ncbi:hypothetical protein NIES4075_60860 [Tolypothrix sp. NIES-4075]|nr:hypothetical protein NIES4075_60860 [Tolypothrix sp. NIES-4075]
MWGENMLHPDNWKSRRCAYKVRLRGLEDFETHGGGFWGVKIYCILATGSRGVVRTKSAIGLKKNKVLKPTEVGLVCVGANFIRQPN